MNKTIRHGGDEPLTNGQPIATDHDQDMARFARVVKSMRGFAQRLGIVGYVAGVNGITEAEAQRAIDGGRVNVEYLKEGIK